MKKKAKTQNLLLLFASYFFYGYANWEMIPLLLVATTIFYFLGIAIQKSTEKKALIFNSLGVFLGVGLLLYFKYLNFFIESFSDLFNTIGLKVNSTTFNIILPLGISFFTFRLISYVIEVRRGKMEATTDFVDFATYVAFFPTILSGPIDRPNRFIPQLQSKRSFDYNLVVDGCRQILWGLFQKVVIADNLAGLINDVWTDIPNQSGSTLLIIAILYSFQIYTDFSGYSHMAIGVGKILGFQITKNFNYPFFSRNLAEFWRNWHISLTSWLTDYIFMPLNVKFRNLGIWGIILAIIINMLLVGMWHGATWTFVVFGLYNGLLFIPLILTGSIFKKKKLKTNKLGLPSLNDSLRIIRTFLIVTLGLIMCRAENIDQAISYILKIISPSLFTKPILTGMSLALTTIIFLFIFVIVEWLSRKNEFPLSNLKINKPLEYTLYFTIIFAIIYFGDFGTNQFIYFKF
ncbi:MBOAT family protein [Lutibacter sp. Hel_I_33_5]|uniref:MBOAT family O-acyltransferase n=1 Tax=Lutibacter sp. Hel_I_33_5 TaxID=1566289 RepID=UPI001647D9D5|nr:MBOAT family protein [Lutibacter sp. Hel_I_33_5]